VPPIFELIRARGGVAERELYQVFNMGIGMIVIVDEAQSEAVLRFIRRKGHPTWRIGEVLAGRGRVHLV
jgi:phosphoribosylformylglycinamidine cyclo-ligase